MKTTAVSHHCLLYLVSSSVIWHLLRCQEWHSAYKITVPAVSIETSSTYHAFVFSAQTVSNTENECLEIRSITFSTVLSNYGKCCWFKCQQQKLTPSPMFTGIRRRLSWNSTVRTPQKRSISDKLARRRHLTQLLGTRKLCLSSTSFQIRSECTLWELWLGEPHWSTLRKCLLLKRFSAREQEG